jgi:hypothetical protein
MKKYSKEYFEEKFEILYKKLLQKEGFIDAVKSTRKELSIPEDGFPSTLELSNYLMDRLSKKEKEVTSSICFMQQYEHKNGQINEEDMKKVSEEFDKRFKDNFSPIAILVSFQMHLDGHNDFFTKDPMLCYGKKNEPLFKITKKLFDKFMDVGLLDPHIIMHFVEKYLFLGNDGVRNYINSKVACSNCRYIGVNHFSPVRQNMKGQDKGPFSGSYLFNENTVKLLSGHFDSVFLIVKPYATKDQVLQYVEDNWNDLREHLIEKNTFYKQYGVHPVIKQSDIDKNQLVYELYKLSKKELVSQYKGEQDLSMKGIYKEKVISLILKEEHDIDMSTDAIKKTATRFAKTVAKHRPKDIEDIRKT